MTLENQWFSCCSDEDGGDGNCNLRLTLKYHLQYIDLQSSACKIQDKRKVGYNKKKKCPPLMSESVLSPPHFEIDIS